MVDIGLVGLYKSGMSGTHGHSVCFVVPKLLFDWKLACFGFDDWRDCKQVQSGDGLNPRESCRES